MTYLLAFGAGAVLGGIVAWNAKDVLQAILGDVSIENPNGFNRPEGP